jgi:phosphotransferase system IIB component
MVADGVQAVFGTASENLKTEMERLMASGPISAQAPLAQLATSAQTAAPQATVAQAGLTVASAAELSARAQRIQDALGGAPNVASSDALALTRVRVQLRDSSMLKTDTLTELGVQGLQQIQPGLYHLIVGSDAEALAPLIERSSG